MGFEHWLSSAVGQHQPDHTYWHQSSHIQAMSSSASIAFMPIPSGDVSHGSRGPTIQDTSSLINEVGLPLDDCV